MKKAVFLLVLVCCLVVSFSLARAETEMEKFIESSKYDELFKSPKVPDGFRSLLRTVKNEDWENVSTSEIRSWLTRGDSADHISQDHLILAAVILAQQEVIEGQKEILAELKDKAAPPLPVVKEVPDKALEKKVKGLEAENKNLKALADERQEEILALREIVKKLSEREPEPTVERISAKPSVDYQKSIREMEAANEVFSVEVKRLTRQLREMREDGPEREEPAPREDAEQSQRPVLVSGRWRVYRVGRIPRKREE